MENLVSPWRLPPTIRGEGLTILRQILAALLTGAVGLGPALRRLHPGVLEDFRRHELAPWIFRVIAQHGLQAQVEDALLTALRRDYVRALHASAREGQEIRLVVQTLEQAGVEVTLFKGAELRWRLYNDAAVRPLADIDLLIRPDQVHTSRLTLETLGFRLQAECADPRPGFRQRFRRELHFDPPPPLPLMVDLHWQLDYPDHFYPFPLLRLHRRALIQDCSGYPVKVPGPEHAYIIMLMHACDGFHGLMQLVDFTLAPQIMGLDWDRFVAEVRGLNFQAPIYLVLRELSRQVEAAVPPPVLQRLSGYSPTWAERLVLRRTLGELTSHFVSLYRQRAWRDRLFYLGAVLWPQASYLRAVYGTESRGQFFLQIPQKLFAPQKA